jgi:hypothetical protein
VIVFDTQSLPPVLSQTRRVTLQLPAAGAVAVTVPSPSVGRVSNPGWPSRFHAILVIVAVSSVGVDVDVNVTLVPATTGLGAQSKLAVGWAAASPVPSGDTTAPTVAKQAVSRSLT